MRCRQKTGRSERIESEQHLSKPEQNMPNLPCPPPHITVISRPRPTPSLLLSSAPPGAFGSTAPNVDGLVSGR